MKKKILLITSLLIINSLISCNNDSLKSDEIPFISEIIVKENFLESALEISNKKEIKQDIFLNIYKDKNILVTRNLKEDFNGKTNTSIVYQNKRFDETLDFSINVIKFDDNYVYGTNYIEITDKNGEVLDSVGIKNFSMDIVKDGSLIKNELNLFATKKFDLKMWYKVRSDNFKYLGNINTPITYREFIKGPKIMEQYKKALFVKDGAPMGGFIETKVSSYGDGDTTNFVYKNVEKLNEVERTRYYFVNTPEIDHTSQGSKIKEEPWGVAAMNFTNNILKNAKHILIQSALGGSIRETYGRLLGFVWYTNKENPSDNDYSLLNYELVLNGYGKFMMGSSLNEMISNEILYYHYFDVASETAKQKGLKIHGEKDPNYKY
jgi:endonuclease YncB( thermonuclease family)